uniref:Phage replication initiation protein n=1 Tax=uncultured marine virus TaxID=186617 RepID=A0A0F7L4V0_9VIRU|nr:phage replication initiation protein [uncultured marine virus]
MFIFQCLITITPSSNCSTNFLAFNSLRSSAGQPSILTILFGETKPSSSACIPRWKYKAWEERGMSRKASFSDMSLLNILLCAISYSIKNPGWKC